MHSHCDFIVLVHGKTRSSTPWPHLSHHPDPERISPCPILIMLSTWLGSDKYTILSHLFDLTRVWTYWFKSTDLPKREVGAQLIRPSRLVIYGKGGVMGCIGSLYCCIVACAHLGNGTGHRTATLAAPQLLMKLCFTVVGQTQSGDGYWLVTVHTYDNFILLPHWNSRPQAPWSAILLSHIILTLSEPVLALS